MLEEEPGHLFRRRQPADDEIQGADPQLVEQHRILARDDLDGGAGVFLEEEPHRHRHDMRRHCRQRADADGLARGCTVAPDELHTLPQRRHRRARMAQEDLACSRDLNAAPVALEDRHAQSLLQLAHRLGDRRLADIEYLGRAHDALLPRHLEKGLQMAEAHPAGDDII